MSDIINRVANSKLKTIDLEELYPNGNRVLFDIKNWLFKELILKEKDFRESVKHHDWSQYKNCFVAVHCSADAIVPTWAYMLVVSSLLPHTKKAVIGDLELLETSIFQELFNFLDTQDFVGKPIIVKGCSEKFIPNSVFGLLIAKLQPISKSIMFGEACSNVPVYKAKKI